jgi:hypothetical protein
MIEPQFWPEHQGAADPVIPGNRVLRVFRLKAGPLSLHVIHIFIPNADEVPFVELPAHVVNRGPIGSEAGKLIWPLARRPIGTVAPEISSDRAAGSKIFGVRLSY